MKEILKVLVGSQAHGLATPESDYDYRAVFVQPTSELLKLGGTVKNTNWIEGKEDNTSWELAHFLNMAVHCNPTILEVFLAPIISPEEAKSGDTLQKHKEWRWAKQLRDLFPHVWNSKGVMDAFIGYGHNQQKKFLEDKEGRAAKYAVAYLRTLMQAHQLLTTGTFLVKIVDTDSPHLVQKLKDWKAGKWQVGEVMQTCSDMRKMVEYAYANSPRKETNIEPINEFLLKVRKEYWDGNV